MALLHDPPEIDPLFLLQELLTLLLALLHDPSVIVPAIDIV